MRKMLRLAALPALLVMCFLPVTAGDTSVTLVHPGIDGVTAPEVKASSQFVPFYPAPARSARTSGTVVVAASVLSNGRVGEVEVLACDRPDMGFEESAVNAVKHWRFKPAQRDGKPVDSYTLVRLYFDPPVRGYPDGVVASQPFKMPTLPLGLAGAPKALGPPTMPGSGDTGISTSRVRDRAKPKLIMPPCTAKDSLPCLYDRRQMERTARMREGEGGPIVTMGQK